MGLTVKELRKKLEEIEEDNPEAEIVVHPPHHRAYTAYYDDKGEIVEIKH